MKKEQRMRIQKTGGVREKVNIDKNSKERNVQWTMKCKVGIGKKQKRFFRYPLKFCLYRFRHRSDQRAGYILLLHCFFPAYIHS